jgi:hypothetical protein
LGFIEPDVPVPVCFEDVFFCRGEVKSTRALKVGDRVNFFFQWRACHVTPEKGDAELDTETIQEDVSIMMKPTNRKRPVITKKPANSKKPVITPGNSKKPVSTKKKDIKKKPTNIKKLANDKKPVITKKPANSKKPVITKKPANSKKPVITKKSAKSKKMRNQ